MGHHPFLRGVLLGLSLVVMLASPLVLAASSTAALAAKSCDLCNDKGYCLSFEDRSSCEVNKSVVQKKWDPAMKWDCSCHKIKKTKAEPDKAACCWAGGNTASKICGSEKKIRTALVVSNPGKLIECGPP